MIAILWFLNKMQYISLFLNILLTCIIWFNLQISRWWLPNYILTGYCQVLRATLWTHDILQLVRQSNNWVPQFLFYLYNCRGILGNIPDNHSVVFNFWMACIYILYGEVKNSIVIHSWLINMRWTWWPWNKVLY